MGAFEEATAAYKEPTSDWYIQSNNISNMSTKRPAEEEKVTAKKAKVEENAALKLARQYEDEDVEEEEELDGEDEEDYGDEEEDLDDEEEDGEEHDAEDAGEHEENEEDEDDAEEGEEDDDDQ